MKHFIFPMNLQLFAEGGAAAGDGGAGEGTGVAAPAAGVQTKGAKSNPLANVVYGKQPQESAPAAEVQKEEPKQEPVVDRHAEFEAMIKGDYKEAFDKRTQDIVQKRLKGAKETEERLTAMNPLLDILSARYGVDASDTAGLIKALEGDDAFFEQAAAENNMDTKQYRNMMKLQSENPTLNELPTTREIVDVFRGYNHNLRISNGEFFNMKNMTSDHYPVLSPRGKRGVYAKPASPQALIAKEKLCYVDGTDFVIGEERIEMGLSTAARDNPKHLVSMGAYVIIMPDKKYINTATGTVSWV